MHGAMEGAWSCSKHEGLEGYDGTWRRLEGYQEEWDLEVKFHRSENVAGQVDNGGISLKFPVSLFINSQQSQKGKIQARLIGWGKEED